MIEAAFLAKRYPQARVVFTGGSGSLIAESKEAPAARELLIELGVDPARIIVEDKSRNTEENAQFTAAIVRPEPKQRWLLVTSAFHMPRAMGCSRRPDSTWSPIRCLSNAWTGKRVAMGLGPWKRIPDFRDRGARMDRPRHIPGNRKDR